MATAVDHRLARLRADRNTCDRALIGGVPASRDLELSERQANLAREGLPAANGIDREPHEPTFWLILGAGGALLLRALLHHAIASPPSRQHDDHHS